MKALSAEIQKTVNKKDGNRPHIRAIDAVLAKKREAPDCRGQDSQAGGRPRALTDAQQRQLVALVFKNRGRAVVTTAFSKRRLRFLRKVRSQTVCNALQAAGLKWLHRRRKAAVPRNHKEPRLIYCRWLRKQTAAFLRNFAYTDGTTFYLARGPAEAMQKQRAALGPCVYRMANGKDGLWDENVGPSLHAKAQGLPVKIWGLFADGQLHYYVLPADGRKTTNMNIKRYNALMKSKFAGWRRKCFPRTSGRVNLVQDHERCLWHDSNATTLREAGFSLVKNFPKCSPNLNAIEGWRRRLKQKLETNAPAHFETRPDFIKRLKRTVDLMNRRHRTEGRKLCRNQKVRARDVQSLGGAKSK